jgi:hypothetical protein
MLYESRGHWDWLFDPEEYGTDERGRRVVNAHGDVDVVRTERTMHAVQLPLERGSSVTIDGETEVFAGFRGDALVWVPSRDRLPDKEYRRPTVCSTEGVQHFNTRVRDAGAVSVEQPE